SASAWRIGGEETSYEFQKFIATICFFKSISVSCWILSMERSIGERANGLALQRLDGMECRNMDCKRGRSGLTALDLCRVWDLQLAQKPSAPMGGIEPPGIFSYILRLPGKLRQRAV
ncbi:MAG: hypothetical protein N2F24_15480, partial [Deltaproteobacteria bacterium]